MTESGSAAEAGGAQDAEAPETNGKEARILRAAVRVFAQNGYHGSSMATVAREAQVATGTIYLYFERKQDLLITLFQRHLGGYIERCRPALEEAEPGVPRLRLLAEMHLAFFAEDRALASVFQIHAREPDPELSEGIRPTVADYFEVIAEVIAAGVTTGAFRLDLDVRLARHVFFGALDEVVTGWVRSKRIYPLMSVLDPLATMLARGFGAAPPPREAATPEKDTEPGGLQ
jgi:TetR/AcrR family fatty acid metabolism transcriptional regulator